ncbi:MAG: hypothetical protein EON87_21750 [Brevundimonas sp.]|nr:MAG: hypothetical protein EON87_21750 [Brevundimonas sp.]
MIAPLLASVIVALQLAQAAPPVLADDLELFETGLRACGITAQPMFTEDSPLTREYWLTLGGPEVTGARARCLAADPSLDGLAIDFPDPEVAEAFAVARAARPDVKAAYEESLRRQRGFLAERGLLENLPRPRPGEALSIFTVALERHCGLEPGVVLEPNEATRGVTFRGGDQMTFEQFSCVFAVISVVAEDEGLGLEVLITGEDAAE